MRKRRHVASLLKVEGGRIVVNSKRGGSGEGGVGSIQNANVKSIREVIDILLGQRSKRRHPSLSAEGEKERRKMSTRRLKK